MRKATVEQLEPIKALIRSIQADTEYIPLVNALHVALTYLEPSEIEWVCALLAVEVEAADVRGYEDIVDKLGSVLDALNSLQRDLDN